MAFAWSGLFAACLCQGLLSMFFKAFTGADPGFSLGGGALVSCSISTPINHIVFCFVFFFFLQNTSCIRKPQVISVGVRTPCTLPLDPALVHEVRLVSPIHCFLHLLHWIIYVRFVESDK